MLHSPRFLLLLRLTPSLMLGIMPAWNAPAIHFVWFFFHSLLPILLIIMIILFFFYGVKKVEHEV